MNIARVNIVVKRGVTNPLSFIPVASDGKPYSVKHLDKAILNIRPIYGLPIQVPLSIGENGLTAVLPPEQTKDLQWRTAFYEVKVYLREVVQIIFEGEFILESDLSV